MKSLIWLRCSTHLPNQARRIFVENIRSANFWDGTNCSKNTCDPESDKSTLTLLHNIYLRFTLILSYHADWDLYVFSYITDSNLYIYIYIHIYIYIYPTLKNVPLSVSSMSSNLSLQALSKLIDIPHSSLLLRHEGKLPQTQKHKKKGKKCASDGEKSNGT
jgi:hypothetical protein